MSPHVTAISQLGRRFSPESMPEVTSCTSSGTLRTVSTAIVPASVHDDRFVGLRGPDESLPEYCGTRRIPALSAPVRSRPSHAANTRSSAPTASALAKCTASAPRSACKPASSPARSVIGSVISTARVAAQKLSHRSSARRWSSPVKRWERLAAAKAARTSGYASRDDTAASQPSQSSAARSLPSSSTSNLTKALLSK